MQRTLLRLARSPAVTLKPPSAKPPSTASSEPSQQQREWPPRFITWMLYLGCIPLIANIHNHLVDSTVINGASMYPYFNENKDGSLWRDRTLNWKFNPSGNLERGLIVTFKSPYHPGQIAVKRIVALEGDVVKTKKPYPFPEVRVPQGHVWVEGDGENTLDSNTYGPISAQLLTGKAKFILLPLRKFGPIQALPDESRLVKRGEEDGWRA